jgi:DNA (cytosine-5)-methyltransferase 1
VTALRYLELFAGAGGMSLGLERAGHVCVAHAEIDAFPRRVLAARWPGLPLYGDVTQLDGRRVVEECGPIDLLTGGSPCQDLSVAGRRAGLAGARSGLFHHQMRLWAETGANLCLWENVVGAMSSRNGRDFAAVLSAFVGGTVLVPRDGWVGERRSGVVSGPAGVVAWRVLDAQFFGVPQRRRRVFVLGARAGRIDPAQVLLEPEGVRWNPPARGEAGEVAPCLPASGAGTARTGNARTECGLTAVVETLAFHHTQDPISGSSAPCLGAEGMGVLAFTQEETPKFGRISPSLDSQGCRRVSDADARVVMIGGEGVTHTLTHEGHDASEDDTGRGTPIIAQTLVAGGRETGPHGALDGVNLIIAADGQDVARCVTAGEGSRQDWETTTVVATLSGHQRQQVDGVGAVNLGVPRRLMPIECERLMDWPDDWTNVDGASDAQRYKAIGNGVASCVAEWIGVRLRDATSPTAPLLTPAGRAALAGRRGG